MFEALLFLKHNKRFWDEMTVDNAMSLATKRSRADQAGGDNTRAEELEASYEESLQVMSGLQSERLDMVMEADI